MKALSDNSARSISGMPPRPAIARSRCSRRQDRHAGSHHQPDQGAQCTIVAKQQRTDQDSRPANNTTAPTCRAGAGAPRH